MAQLVELTDIRAACEHLSGVAIRTPLLSCPRWPDLLLKPENLQPVGAFKLRGAVHALAQLGEAQRDAGVITHSSGNHGQALAYAARRLGVTCVVVMPEVAPAVKVAAVRASGAQVVLVEPPLRESTCARLAQDRGLVVIPPYDHRDVIAGQGTVGLEIVEELPELGCVLVPVGGGGLASGVATAVKALAPSAAVIGVEPELAADAQESLARRQVVVWPPERTYATSADGLRTHLSELTLAHLLARCDGIVTVSEEEISAAVAALAVHARVVAEPSGAVAAAAWLHHAAALRERFGVPMQRPAVAVISGGNIEPAALSQLLRSQLLS